MKKILEVVQYGDFDIRFNTDLKEIDQARLPEIIAKLAWTMTTKLVGGNEAAVLAMIRALALADLSVSVNRKEMIKALDEDSAALAKLMHRAIKEMKKQGRVVEFPIGFTPGKAVS